MARSRVGKNRHQGRLGQLRAEENPDRIHREKHIHGGDVAVAGVFLGEEQRLFVGIGRQAAGGHAFAISQRANLRITRAANFRHVGHQILVKFFATFEHERIILRRGLQHFRRFHAVAPPIGTQVSSEILDRVNFVISHDDLPFHGCGADGPRSKTNASTGYCRFTARGICASSVGRQTAVLDKAVKQCLVRADGGC